MSIIWTPEKVSQLTLEEIKRLAENAKARGGEEVFAFCQAEIQARKPKPKASSSLPEGFVKAARSAIAKNLERDAVDLMVHLAKQLTSRYDLSSEKAREPPRVSRRLIGLSCHSSWATCPVS